VPSANKQMKEAKIMRAARFHFAVLVLGMVVTLMGASSAGAQCAAAACGGAGDCKVDAASGVDAGGCCTALTPCKTIEFAVGQVAAGATIKVAAGTYQENPLHTVTINKTVTLCGANAGVDARGARGPESIISNERGTTVFASNVVLDGFTFQDAGTTQSNFPYGLDMAQGTQGTQVYNNIVQNNIYGIALANTGPNQVKICQNLLQNNNNQPNISASGTGIYTDEFVCGNVGGARPCTNFLITDNKFAGNDDAGIDLSNTDPAAMTNVDIGNNTFDGNGRAVVLFNVDQSNIHNNVMTNSTLAGSGDVRIFGTDFGGGVDGLAITSNNMSGGAGWAIRITNGPNSDITIHLNNIANYAGDNTVPSSPNPGGLFVSAGAYPGVLDATCNWWNDPCGPFNVTNNPTGPGEEVREGVPSNVNFISWLLAPSLAPLPGGGGTCTGAPNMCSVTTTSTSTSTTTSTTLIDHVQCYEVKPAAFTVTTVTAQDQFGTLSLSLRFPHRLCAPANKNGEGILDPTEHLTAYKTKGTFTKRFNQTVVNQFGTLTLDVVRPELFMVPTAKNGVPLAPPPGDHFTCYKVKRTRGAAKFVPLSVTVADQFQSVTETVIKPMRLCAPANKNNEDPSAPLHPDHLLCYKTRSTTTFGTVDVSISNQFGPDQLTLIHRRELCVPSIKNPGATTTTTSSSTSTSSSTTSSTSTTTSTTLVGSPSGAFVDPTGS
jgi:hypothetical protein